MKTTPLIHSTAAALYIVIVVFFMNALQSANTPDNTILIPMFMISLVVISVAMMGLLFVYKPLTLYIDGRKKDALEFFLKTLGIFAAYFVVFFAAYLYATLG